MYVGGFVLAVKTDRKAEYLEMAREVSETLRRNGATRVVECWGDDVPEGKRTSFPMAVKREADETVLFSWMEFPDRETYSACIAAMEKEETPDMPERMRSMMDPGRMIWGGFEVILDA